MLSKVQILLILVVLVLGAFYICSSKKNEKKENFANVGSSQLLSLTDNYDHVDAPEYKAATTEQFADLVGVDDSMELVSQREPTMNERFDELSGRNLLPRLSSSVTPYNIDVAQPSTHMFSVNAPRVQLKDPVWSQSDKIRGDIPIAYSPNVPVIGKSIYGRDSWNGSGYFSDHYKGLYAKHVGRGYKNMPLKVVNEEIVMDSM